MLDSFNRNESLMKLEKNIVKVKSELALYFNF